MQTRYEGQGRAGRRDRQEVQLGTAVQARMVGWVAIHAGLARAGMSRQAARQGRQQGRKQQTGKAGRAALDKAGQDRQTIQVGKESG